MSTTPPAKRARLLLPSPEVWKARRPKPYQAPGALREHLQLAVPAVLMVLLVQGFVLWRLLLPVTPLVSVPRLLEEPELRIELNSLNFDPPPPPPPPPPRLKAAQARSAPPVALPAPATAREVPAPARPTQPAPAPSVPAVPVLSMPTPPAPTPLARLSVPTLSLEAPAALTTEELTEEQGITESGIDRAQARVAPLRMIAERPVENPSPLIPMPTLLPPVLTPEPAVTVALVPLLPDRVRPTLQTPTMPPIPLLVVEPTAPPPTPVRLAPTPVRKRQIEPIALQVPRLELEPAAPQAPTQAAVAPLKMERPELAAAPAPVAAPQVPTSTPNEQLAPALVAAVPLSAKAALAPSEPSLSAAQAVAPIAFANEPSVARPIAEGQSSEAQDTASPARELAGSDAALVADPFAGEGVRPGRADGLPSADDLLGSIGGTAREQVQSQATARGDGRLPWRRYDDPFIDELPGRLAGLRVREPALFNEISRFLVRTLSPALLGAALGVSEEYDDSVGTDLGPLIDMWIQQHHGDLGLACRQAAGMTAAAREILCTNVAP